jgi:hypothetical protein
MSTSPTGVNSTVCWFPDRLTTGASTVPEFVPCDPSARQSACCAVGESCVGEGLCYSDMGTIYRGGCTDKTWADKACSPFCSSSVAGINLGTSLQILNEFGGECCYELFTLMRMSYRIAEWFSIPYELWWKRFCLWRQSDRLHR